MTKKILYILTLFAFTAFTATTVYGSDVKGKVVIKNAVARKNLGGLSALYSKPGSRSDSATNPENIIVYIKDISGSPAKPIHDAKLRQIDKIFVPHVLPVTVGTAVEFPNLDEIYHNVFSLSKNNEFNLGKYAMGKSNSHTFTKSGIVEVFCDIHSGMYGYIIVLTNKYFARVDKDGNYVIKDVPPGNYTLVAWHESFPPKEYTITVTQTGEVIQNIEF